MAVIDTRGGSFQNLPGTLLQMLVTKNQQEQAAEDLALRKKNFQLQQEQYQNDRTIAERDRQNQIAGAQGILQFLMQANPQAAQVLQGVPAGGLPTAVAGVLSGMESLARTRNLGAGAASTEQDTAITAETRASTVAEAEARARSAGVAADVAQATAPAQVDQAFANLADTNLRNQFQAQVLRGSDPVNGARAVEAWISSGGQLTFNQAAEAVGFTGETSINPELRYQAPTTQNADAARAAGYLPLMMETNETIRALHQAGVRISLPAAIQKSSRSGTVDAFLNAITDPRQQQLVQSSRAYADMYRFSLSGQQSGEAERMAMLMSITDQFGDSDATLAQKQRLRDVMTTLTQQRATGSVSALEAAEVGLRVAMGLGDDAVTAAFQERVDAVREDMTRGVSISSIPGDTSFGDVGAVIDSVLGGN